MNSIRTTYLPRAKPKRLNFPSEFVAATYFFSVSVFVAVTVTPGSGVLLLRAEPEISNVTGAGAAAACGADGGAAVAVCGTGAEAGGASCAVEARGHKISAKLKTKMARQMSRNSKTPRLQSNVAEDWAWHRPAA